MLEPPDLGSTTFLLIKSQERTDGVTDRASSRMQDPIEFEMTFAVHVKEARGEIPLGCSGRLFFYSQFLSVNPLFTGFGVFRRGNEFF